MADSTSNIDSISSTQAQKEVTANASLNAASKAMFGANRATTTSALTWGYYGGRYFGTSVANGTLALTASTTNYIVANRTSGAITGSTATTNWNNFGDYIRLYSVVTASASISSYQDHRQAIVADRRYAPVNTQTGSGSPLAYTLTVDDCDKVVEINNANAVTLTLPNSLSVGFRCQVVQVAAGAATFSAASGASLRNRASHTKTNGQWAVTELYVRSNAGGAAAEYVLGGDTAA
jgi:hypothetical protein